jgi:hypothetical protein
VVPRATPAATWDVNAPFDAVAPSTARLATDPAPRLATPAAPSTPPIAASRSAASFE